jgi:hypothetical protein
MIGIEASGALVSRSSSADLRCAKCGAPIEEQMLVVHPTGDTCASCTRARFNDAFAGALAVFGVNVHAWRLGMTWEQNQAFRELCEGHSVAFDPDHYVQLEGGSFAGWIGGTRRGAAAQRGPDRYVEVSPDGAVREDSGA